MGDLLLDSEWPRLACIVVPLLCSFALVVLLCIALSILLIDKLNKLSGEIRPKKT